ncbi:MAG: hypothetical protein ABSF46_21700 [Terriglobia bacterium]
MSLRKATCLTPRRVDAARHNSERSTGPRSEAGKKRMKMNALKHGCDAAPENDADVMRALGEDPERFAGLKRELATAYGPGDALWNRQTEDLAKLYWRRNRIERMETGLMRRALQEVEERERTRREQIAAATFDASSSLATDLKLGVPTEPCARLRQQLSRLGAIHEQLRRGVVGQEFVIQKYLPPALGARPARIGELMLMFSNRAYCMARKDKGRLNEIVNEMGGEANVDVLWRELLRLLEEEVAAVKAAFAEEVAVQEEKDAIERDACLAPAGETWEMLLRQEAALDRSIDRKVKILLTMRKEHAQEAHTSRQKPSGRMRHPSADSPPGQESNDREAEELSKLVGLDRAEVAPNFSTAGADPSPGSGQALKVSATTPRTESPQEEIAIETPKLPEQSENVIDKKGPAAERSSTGGVREPGKELPTDVPELQLEDAKSQVQR